MQFFDNALVDKFGIPKDKVAENILSAIQNPEEAVFKGEGD